MNTVGLAVLWTALQISGFCLGGIGLYLVARRHSPAAGAWAVGAILFTVLGISALALSPWPQWWTLAAVNDETVEATPAVEPAAKTKPAAAKSNAPLAPLIADAANARPEPLKASKTWGDWLIDLKDRQPSETQPRPMNAWRWPAWLAAVVLAGCGLALVRLIVAVAAVSGYRHLTRPVYDDEMLELLDALRAELACRRAIELREVATFCSPSTLGWLRPLIVLPADWREWNDRQRRAILAHEVAHVAHGDFAMWIVSQVGLALHFYNPLVHWLAGRLRLEQELFADACGARLAGGRQRYLTVLAEIALRQDSPPATWAAQPFLATHGTLMRRIEVLHDQKTPSGVTLSWIRRAGLAMFLIAAGCLVAGLRGPVGNPLLYAAQPGEAAAAESTTTGQVFNLDFVPDDALMVMALRPDQLVNIPLLGPFRSMLQGFGLFDPLGLPLADIEECKVVVAGSVPAPGQGRPPQALLMIKAKRPFDWKKLAAYFVPDAEETPGAGQTYFRAAKARPGGLDSYWIPDDRTIVFTEAAKITSTFSLRGPANNLPFAKKWAEVAKSSAVMAMKMDLFEMTVNEFRRGPRGNNVADAAAVAPADLTEAGDFVILSARQNAKGLLMSGEVECRSPEAAAKVMNALQQAFVTFKSGVQSARGSQAGTPGSQMESFMAAVVDQTKLSVQGNTLHSDTLLTAALTGKFSLAVRDARAASHLAQAINKLKQISIAFHNYHDVHQHFPAAVEMGPDGKTPHSWRVEILPYMELPAAKVALAAYKLDEPWDSPDNLKAAKLGAELFNIPSDKPSQDCGFFVVTGPGTVFDPDEPPTKIRNIIDGTSRTVGFVEAKRAIPWTKPEDIECDPAKPLPKLGGNFQQGTIMGLMDGSVHITPREPNETALRALISRDGREPVSMDDLKKPNEEKSAE